MIDVCKISSIFFSIIIRKIVFNYRILEQWYYLLMAMKDKEKSQFLHYFIVCNLMQNEITFLRHPFHESLSAKLHFSNVIFQNFHFHYVCKCNGSPKITNLHLRCCSWLLAMSTCYFWIWDTKKVNFYGAESNFDVIFNY